MGERECRVQHMYYHATYTLVQCIQALVHLHWFCNCEATPVVNGEVVHLTLDLIVDCSRFDLAAQEQQRAHVLTMEYCPHITSSRLGIW